MHNDFRRPHDNDRGPHYNHRCWHYDYRLGFIAGMPAIMPVMSTIGIKTSSSSKKGDSAGKQKYSFHSQFVSLSLVKLRAAYIFSYGV